jgi:hypothetical protein
MRPLLLLPQGSSSQPKAAAAPPQSLQAELVGWRAELAGLRVESDRLRAQLKQTPGITATSIEARSTQVGLQIAEVEGRIAQVQSQIAAGPERTSTTTVPPSGDPFARQPSPILVTQMLFVLALAAVIPLSIAFARRLARGGTRSENRNAAEIASRLDRLEEAVDSVAIEVERISEGQRYVTKVLADRPQVGSPDPRKVEPLGS